MSTGHQPASPPPVPATCRRRSSRMTPCSVRGFPSASTVAVAASSPRSGSVSFARPKSRTFTTPSALTMMLVGFRSRCTIRRRAPWPEHRRSAPRIERLGEPHSVVPDPSVERLALSVLHRDEVGAVRPVNVVDVDDVGMVERGGGFRLPGRNGACGRGRRLSLGAGPSRRRSGRDGCRGPCGQTPIPPSPSLARTS